MIKTAILGYGRSGSTLHANPLEQLTQDFRVTAVCDIDPEARNKAQARFGCAVYGDYHLMLRNEPLDLVVIVTRSDQHCAMTCDVLQAGVPVLVTKPWAVEATEAERMVTVAAETGTPLLPWLPARWGCDLRRLKELLAEGVIGKVFLVRRREFSFGLRQDWQTERRYGGGYLLNWGPHIVDQAVELLDEPVRSVYGQLRQVINPGDVEDMFYAVLKTSSGALLTCEYTIAIDKLPNWVIQGDRGTIFVKEKTLEIHQVQWPEKLDETAYRNKPEIRVTTEDLEGNSHISMGRRYGDPYVIYPEIARALRGEQPFAVTPAHALQVSKLLDAIRESAARDQTIPFAADA